MESLYIIHGEEDLLRFEALDLLRKQAKNEGYFNRKVLTVENHFNWDELSYALESQELFSEKKIIELHIPNGKPGKLGSEKLLKLSSKIKKIQDELMIIFLPKLEKAQIESKWFKSLTSVGKIIEAKAIHPKDLPNWISNRLASYQLTIEKDALLLLAERVEGNLLAASQEIEKIALLYPAGSLLKLNEIKKVIANVARFDVFQISEAWMTGKISRLINLLEGLEFNGTEPILMIWIISEDLRTLIRLSGALHQGKPVASVKNVLKLWGEKQYHAVQAVKRISSRQLIEALQRCADIDRRIKGVESGEVWPAIRDLLIDLSK